MSLLSGDGDCLQCSQCDLDTQPGQVRTPLTHAASPVLRGMGITVVTFFCSLTESIYVDTHYSTHIMSIINDSLSKLHSLKQFVHDLSTHDVDVSGPVLRRLSDPRRK